MQNCKLFVFFSDELVIYQCRSENPASFVLNIAGFDTDKVNDALYIRLEWYEDTQHNSVTVDFVSYEGTKALFKPVTDIVKNEKEAYHLVEMNDYILIKKIADEEVMDYKAKADTINRKFRGSLASQVRQLISDETVTNQYLFKMLLQIDAKLDELLASKQDVEQEGFTTTRMLCLSGGGLCFLSENVSWGDIFFFQTDTRYTSGITFAGLCAVRNVIESGNSHICECDIIHIDETTRDNIIRMVFEKDREKLKRKNN